ncbi:hypothetical protein GQ42DRAFT_161609 [Ramicandelaber brevisporus]|nr:hypothetical protein GQ42DRAFT_161609 [Ramicandelaber brevisporus]
MNPSVLRVAVQGCGHGMLDRIYSQLQTRYAKLPDVLLICGDFQAIRHQRDLDDMAVPAKYKHMGDFQKYYTGEAEAPILTIIIGGNHEASGHFAELFYGGWVAPNIYYLGAAGSVILRKHGCAESLRITGVSGIFKDHDYDKPRAERLPLSEKTQRSIYHTRRFDTLRMLLLGESVYSANTNAVFDVVMSHDWPVGVTSFGNEKKLLQIKPHFRADVQKGQLGSPGHTDLLRVLRPRHWFAAHMHVKFEADVSHATLASDTRPLHYDERQYIPRSMVQQQPKRSFNPDEISLDMGDDDDDDSNRESAPAVQTEKRVRTGSLSTSTDSHPVPVQTKQRTCGTLAKRPGTATTRFLALDKCTERRLDNLDMAEIEMLAGNSKETGEQVQGDGEGEGDGKGVYLEYDPHWLAVIRATNSSMPRTHGDANVCLPITSSQQYAELVAKVAHQLAFVQTELGSKSSMKIPVISSTATAGTLTNVRAPHPQTARFCTWLGIDNHALY